MAILDTPREHATTPATRRINGIRQMFFRTADTVPGRLTAALALGLSGLFLAFVSIWSWLDDLNQWGTFGMRFGFFVMLAFPLAVTALTMSTSYRLREWRSLGMIRMIMTNAIGVVAVALSIFSAYVMYSALP